MARIRILLVDDSVVIRRGLTKLLGEDPALEVVGASANGRLALARIPQVNPDLVILDVDMPEMNGLETLRELRRLYPTLPVIMFSGLTERGARITLEALFRGAMDYVTKPSEISDIGDAAAVVRTELIPKIKVLCQAESSPQPWPEPVRAVRPRQVRRAAESVAAVVVGASTGGPAALKLLLGGLPRPLPVPVLVVQHMPPMFTLYLARQLETKSAFRVREAEDGAPIGAGDVWIAPGGVHMKVVREDEVVRLRLSEDPPENSCRPAADVLFRAAARVWGAGVLAVVLTGMGRDGLRGCEAVHEAGGRVVVQDRASSVVWGMPGFVAEAGLADDILPPSDISAWLAARLAPESARSREADKDDG